MRSLRHFPPQQLYLRVGKHPQLRLYSSYEACSDLTPDDDNMSHQRRPRVLERDAVSTLSNTFSWTVSPGTQQCSVATLALQSNADGQGYTACAR